MTDTAPRRPRVRRSFRRVAIVIFVLLIPLACHALWDYVEARRLSRVVEEIRARGEPVHFGRVGEGGPVTAEQKRAAKYYGAAALMTADGYTYLDQFSNAARLIEAMSRESAPVPVDDSRLGELRALTGMFSPALELLDRAAALDANGLDYASEPRFGFPERDLAKVNALRIADKALTGDGDGAAQALIATLRLRRAMKDRFALTFPVITTDSLRTIVAFSTPGESSLKALQQTYAQRDDENAVERQLISARAMMIQGFWPGAHGELASLPRVRTPRVRVYMLDGVIDTALRPWYTNRLRRMLALYAEAIAASGKGWPAKLDAAEALEARYPVRRQPFGTQSTFGRPAPFFENGPAADFARIARQTASVLAQDRVCMTVVAIERYRRQRGAPPPTLQALVPEILTAVPTDPYSGSPLGYARTTGGYKVYSVGTNRRDDGGDLAPPRSDVSVPSRQPEAGDLGMAVPVSKAGKIP